MHLISSPCQAPRDETDAGDGDPGDGAFYGCLEVLGETAAASKPGKGPLHDPAPGQNLEALGGIATLDDLDGPLADLVERPSEFLPCVTELGTASVWQSRDRSRFVTRSGSLGALEAS